MFMKGREDNGDDGLPVADVRRTSASSENSQSFPTYADFCHTVKRYACSRLKPSTWFLEILELLGHGVSNYPSSGGNVDQQLVL